MLELLILFFNEFRKINFVYLEDDVTYFARLNLNDFARK